MIEFWLFVKKLTFKKTVNFFVRSFYILLSRCLKKVKIKAMPWSYSIEPTNLCNLKCRECASGLGLLIRRKGNISIENFRIAADNIAPYALNCFLYFQGEPFLNKDFFEMVKYAHKKRIFLATSTNGHFITEETAEKTSLSGLDKIIVSLDGFNQESYSAYRKNGDFQTVINAIKFLSKAKKKLGRKNPIIEVQTIVNKINENNLQEIKAAALKAGADKFYLKTMQIENAEDFPVFKTSIEKYSRYDNNNRLKHRVGFCLRILNSAVITIDLDVVPCCYDKDAAFSLGKISSNNLKEILLSPKAVTFYQQIEFQRDKRPEMCENCGG
ncbi:MAG: radical SAM protein [Bacteroidales bacterium]|nr:radical SAM protein [Bacteroidales bacterium]